MLAQQKHQLIALLRQALAGLGVADATIVLERPKVEAHGDIATNVALQIAKGLKRNPREVATAIVDALKVNPAAAELVEAAEVAGPGFINLRIAPTARRCASAIASARRPHMRAIA
jgi:arginyl-tRNA synthetase